jgi:riboflavin biosynthesis pyrimidine reductase
MADPAAAERIEVRLRELYGSVPEEVAVLHVASVWQRADGERRVLRVGPETPCSEIDGFVLSLARARADAIVTTGRILRAEPELTHASLGPDRQRADLAEWRRLRLARHEPARTAVLTSGGELDLDHPLLRAAHRPLIATRPESAARLGDAAARRGIEVLALDPLDARALLAALRARGARCISIEAGPQTALPLYDSPLAIDELLLSIYAGPEPPVSAIGGPFLAAEQLARLLPRAARSPAIDSWSFERRIRV